MRIRALVVAWWVPRALLGAVWSSWRFTDGRAVRATVTDEPGRRVQRPEPAVSAATSVLLLTVPSALMFRAPAASSPWSVPCAVGARDVWCGDGLIEHLRDLRRRSANSNGWPKAYEAGRSKVSRMENRRPREAVALERFLRSRGDRRSFAMAEYLALTHQSAEAKEQASSRLVKRWRVVRPDPSVTALALKRPL